MMGKIEEKKALLEVLEDLLGRVDDRLNSYSQIYAPTGEMEQKQEWDRETATYKPVFDEDGNPIMKPVKEWRKRTDAEMSDMDDYDKVRVKAWKLVQAALEKLV